MMWGDIKLTPDQIMQYVLGNATNGVGDVKKQIAPKMYNRDMSNLNEARKKLGGA